MAFDGKTLKRDGSGITPVPQHFDPTANDYEPVYGRNNASRVELYGADGNPTSTDFATQTTLAAILAKIITAPSTEVKQDALNALIGEVQASPTANTLLARLKSLEDKIDAIIDGSAPAVVLLSGSTIPDAQAIPTRVMGSAIALPVDIQYHDFASEDTPLGASAVSEQGKAAATGLELIGFSITETNDADAKVNIHKGTANTDPLLFSVTLAPSESAREYFAFGIKSAGGIYIDRVSGATDVTLFTRVVA